MREVAVTVSYEAQVVLNLRNVWEGASARYAGVPTNLVDFERWLTDHADILEEYCSTWDVELREVDFVNFSGDFEPEDYPVPDDDADDEYGLYRWVPRHPDQLEFALAD